MKRFLISVIVLGIAVSFASISLADISFTPDFGRMAEKLDISEKNIIDRAKVETIKAGEQGEIITSIKADIPAQSRELTQHGLVNFYVVSVDISVQGDTDYKYIYCVYTGETEGAKFYNFGKHYAADANLNDQMIGYEKHLAQFITRTKEKEDLTSAVLTLAAL